MKTHMTIDEPMSGASKYSAQTEWNKTHTRLIQLKLNLRTDADVLERLDQVSSKQGYIKRLIREDMKRGAE